LLWGILLACIPFAACTHQGSQHPSNASPFAAGDTACRIERLPQTETILGKMGRPAWVYRFSGGHVNIRFQIFVGRTLDHVVRDPDEELQLQFDGHDALLSAASAAKASGKEIAEEGFFVAELPDTLGIRANRTNPVPDEELTFVFARGPRSTLRMPLGELVPSEFFEKSGASGFGGNGADEWVLHPGDTANLSSMTYFLSLPDAEESLYLRYDVTAARLTDDQIRSGVTCQRAQVRRMRHRSDESAGGISCRSWSIDRYSSWRMMSAARAAA
jgi:hypothetical protein